MSRPFRVGDKVRAKKGTQVYEALGYRADEIGTVKNYGCGGLYIHFGTYLAVSLKNIGEQIEHVSEIQRKENRG